MGCAGSKLEELNAVSLCRDRSDLLAEAIRHRYALADAHAAYAESLRSVGVALHRLLDGGFGAHFQGSPFLSLPAQRKGDPLPPPSPAAAAAEAISSVHAHSRSQSGSHMHFHSSGDSDSDVDSLLLSDGDSPVHLHLDNHEVLNGKSYFSVHYARSYPPPPSVTFELRVERREQVHYGTVAEPSSSSSYSYPFSDAYQLNYYGYPGLGGLFGSSSPSSALSQPPPVVSEANSNGFTSQVALPPPSPPRTSTWDFLNPFESSESCYPPYTPSRSSKELREDEGIPDLEEDEDEVIKEAYGDQKLVASTSAVDMTMNSSKGASVSEDDVGSLMEDSSYDPRAKEGEVGMVEKNIVGSVMQKLREERRTVAALRRYHDISEVASQIRVQFERAAESTKELARVLEVGKLPYNRKKSVFAASSRMMCVIPVFVSKDDDLVYVEDKVTSCGNLSSTLQKLYIWEQKLHDEIRVEEKMRLLHDRNSKKLKRLDERGAEAHKIEVTEAFIRKLSTKIRIAIRIVNSITTKINVLRDEELWPQIDELINGFERMWGVMLECHQIQSQAIAEVNYLDSIASKGQASYELMNAIMHLEMELLRWIGNFSAWINSQKSFVNALNSWLVRCLHCEPEVTADGIPPCSPGRIGAPPVFVILNCWSQALDRVSEKEIMFAMQSSVVSIKQIWQQNDLELRQKVISNRDMERLFKMRGKEARVLNNEVEALNVSVNQSAEPSSLLSALRQLFQSMENFATNVVKAYEDLLSRGVEEKAIPEETKGSQV